MDATSAAAMLAVFAGEVALRCRAMELADRAGLLARTAYAVGVPSCRLAAFAGDLMQADDTTRKAVVEAVGREASSLEAEATTRRDTLRQCVARLRGECLEPPLPCTARICELSDMVLFAAAGLSVRREALARAVRCLTEDTGEYDAPRPQSVAELVNRALEMDEAAGARFAVLIRGAAELALACQELRRVADAVPVVRRAAEETRAQPPPPPPPSPPPPPPPPPPQQQRRTGDEEMGFRDEISEFAAAEKTREVQLREIAKAASDSQGYALGSSVTLLPTLIGPQGTVRTFSQTSISVFFYTFCGLASMIALGSLSTSWVTTRYEVAFAHVASRLGLMGINALIVLYTHEVLGPDTPCNLGLLLTLVIAVHLSLAAWQLYQNRRA